MITSRRARHARHPFARAAAQVRRRRRGRDLRRHHPLVPRAPAAARPVRRRSCCSSGSASCRIGVALTGNVAGFEYTLKRRVLQLVPRDAAVHARTRPTRRRTSLAAIHSRNSSFGGESCYTCHADYQIFGAMTTKVNGLKHLYYYVTAVRATPGAYGESGPRIHLYKPFQNGSARAATRPPRRTGSQVEDHGGMIEDIRSGDASCVDCHGGAQVHPRSFAHGGNGRAPGGVGRREEGVARDLRRSPSVASSSSRRS